MQNEAASYRSLGDVCVCVCVGGIPSKHNMLYTRYHIRHNTTTKCTKRKVYDSKQLYSGQPGESE